MLATPGERGVIGRGQSETQHPEDRRQEAFSLPQGQVEDEPERQRGFDGEIGILPLPATFADPHGLPSGDRIRGQPHGDIASLDQCSVVCRPISDVVFCLVLRVHARLHVEIMHLPSLRWPGGRSWRTEGAGSSSSPGGLLPRGPHQNRTRRFPPSGSSADVAHGDAPQIRTRIRGTGRGYRANNATNLGQGPTTFRMSGDMSPDVNAPVMGPFERSHQHGPPLLGRVRGPTRSPTSSLVCSPPTPALPSAAAPVVPGRWPTLSLVRQGGRRASQVPGPSSSSVP